MGKVVVTVTMENAYDLYDAERAIIPPEKVRRVEVTGALVDTGATYLSLPRNLIGQLGLRRFATRSVRTTAGPVSLEMYGLVRLTIQGRFCHVEVAEVEDRCPVLVG